MQKKSFKIDNNIYSEDIISQAVLDFSEIANIIFSDWFLNIESDWDVDEIFNEFMNYSIALHNEY